MPFTRDQTTIADTIVPMLKAYVTTNGALWVSRVALIAAAKIAVAGGIVESRFLDDAKTSYDIARK